MVPKRNRARWAQWRQRMRRQRESRLSITEFCRREGICRVSFQAWKRKLREATKGRSATQRRIVGPASSRRQGAVSGRVEARRSRIPSAARKGPADFFQVPVLAARSSPWIEFSLSDGSIVRIPQGNLAALETLLRALRGSPAGLVSEADHA